MTFVDMLSDDMITHHNSRPSLMTAPMTAIFSAVYVSLFANRHSTHNKTSLYFFYQYQRNGRCYFRKQQEILICLLLNIINPHLIIVK